MEPSNRTRAARVVRAVSCVALALAAHACGAPATPPAPPPPPAQLTLITTPPLLGALTAYAEMVPDTRVAVIASDDPARELAAGRGAGLRVAVLDGLTCEADCYRLEPAGVDAVVVRGNGALGAQYGVTDLLERAGYRFLHPTRARVPAALPATVPPDDGQGYGRTLVAEHTRRGLQLHTLHPIEGLALWVPGADNLALARRVIDWTVRNRGNFLQLAALDDIQRSEPALAAWRSHARAVLAYAHLRGVRVGVAIQLFGTSSLQRAYDLLERHDEPDAAGRARAELERLTAGLEWDEVGLKFGEFSGVPPEAFIERVNGVSRALAELSPATEMSATIHVGNYPSLRVTYQGESMLYYFLVRYADARIVPWVHTVMYYTLFDDAGGAYNHDDFGEHREFLLARLRAGQRVTYYPESAYWVAFDNSVPTYLPVYTWARHRDLSEVRARARAAGHAELRESVTFTSGWEWGYWQTDAAVLRMGFALPARWSEPIEQMYAPWGAAGAVAAAQIARLGELQRVALIERRLAAYIAGRDALIDLVEQRGTVAQPPRPTPAAVAAMDAPARERFAATVLAPLDELARGSAEVVAALASGGVAGPDPWLAEVRDGAEVDALRARFVAEVYRGAAAYGRARDDGGAVERAAAVLDEARAVVRRRHADLHWPDRRRLLSRFANPTLYQHGYLHYADTLCYWERELVELRVATRGDTATPPGCAL